MFEDMDKFVPKSLKTYSKDDPESSKPTWVSEDPEARAIM